MPILYHTPLIGWHIARFPKVFFSCHLFSPKVEDQKIFVACFVGNCLFSQALKYLHSEIKKTAISDCWGIFLSEIGKTGYFWQAKLPVALFMLTIHTSSFRLIPLFVLFLLWVWSLIAYLITTWQCFAWLIFRNSLLMKCILEGISNMLACVLWLNIVLPIDGILINSWGDEWEWRNRTEMEKDGNKRTRGKVTILSYSLYLGFFQTVERANKETTRAAKPLYWRISGGRNWLFHSAGLFGS